MPNWMPSLNALRALEAVSRHKSFQGAAQELKVTPAAVKQLVVKLEATVGRKLVVRDGRGIALTETANHAQADLGLAMGHLSGAVRKMREGRNRNRLIVSVEASLATTWLVPRLEEFRILHPNISVLIDSSQVIVDLERTDNDIAIRYGVPARQDLITRRLFEDEVFPACGPTLLNTIDNNDVAETLRRGPLIHWDMAHLPWAKRTKGLFDWKNWAHQIGLKQFDSTQGLRFNDYGLAVQAAISGQGFILASGPILQDAIHAGLLVQPFPNLTLQTGIGYDIVTTIQATEAAEVSAFCDWLLGLVKTKKAPQDAEPFISGQ